MKQLIFGVVGTVIGVVAGYYINDYRTASQLESNINLASQFFDAYNAEDAKDDIRKLLAEDAKFMLGEISMDTETFLEGGVVDGQKFNSIIDNEMDVKYDKSEMIVQEDGVCTFIQSTYQVEGVNVRSWSNICMKIKEDKIKQIQFGFAMPVQE